MVPDRRRNKKIEVIAVGNSIREVARLRKIHGKGRWRKMKGAVNVILPGGKLRKAEVHWYEAHGVGKKEFKIKRLF